MNTAILIDGAFLRKKFHAAFKKDITAENVLLFAQDLLAQFKLSPDDLHRMYYYDCAPCTAKTSTPVTNRAFLFEKTPQYTNGIKLLSDIKNLIFLQFVRELCNSVVGNFERQLIINRLLQMMILNLNFTKKVLI